MFRVESMGKACPVSRERFPKRENLARFPRDISPDGKTLPGFRGTFSRAGKACSVPGERFPGWENLARFQGNIFPGGKTLPRCAGTFSQAGKPCPARGERFPRRENLARFPRNIFPSGKTLPRSWGTFSQAGKSLPRSAGTFSQAGKPRRAPREHFPRREKLAALRGRLSTIICSPPSFPIRPHQGGHARRWRMLTKKRWVARRHHFPFAHIRAYAIRPYSWRRKTFKNRCQPSPHHQRTNGKYVGGVSHTPSTWANMPGDGEGSRKSNGMLATIILCLLTSGRMRYAPTPVRSY